MAIKNCRHNVYHTVYQQRYPNRLLLQHDLQVQYTIQLIHCFMLNNDCNIHEQLLISILYIYESHVLVSSELFVSISELRAISSIKRLLTTAYAI